VSSSGTSSPTRSVVPFFSGAISSYDYENLPRRIYRSPSPQDIIMLDESPQPSIQEDPPCSESSSSTRRGALPWTNISTLGVIQVTRNWKNHCKASSLPLARLLYRVPSWDHFLRLKGHIRFAHLEGGKRVKEESMPVGWVRVYT